MSQTPAEMKVRIVHWLRHDACGPFFQAVLPTVPSCERLHRRHRVNEIRPLVREAIVADAITDGLLIAWFNEHRTPELRQADAAREHEHRDVIARLGVPLGPYRGPAGQNRT